MKKLSILFLLLALTIFPVQADVAISSNAAVVMEMQTGQVLFEKDGAKKILPANTAKIMTALVALENGDLEKDTITIENDEGTLLKAGDILSLKEALAVMLMRSSNECAKAVARKISEKDFTKLMNEKAKALGILNTVFDNPAGGKNETEYTTAYDMAVITRTALENETFLELFTTKNTTIGTDKAVSSSVEMMAAGDNFYEYVTGGLTTNSAELGNTIVLTAKKGMLDLIVILLDSGSTKYSDSKKLLDDIFDNFYKTTIEAERYPLPTAKATGSFGRHATIEFSLAKELVLVLPNQISIEQLTFTNDIKPKYKQAKEYEAYLTITAEGRAPITLPLITAQGKESSGVITILLIILLVIIGAVLIILGIAAYYIIRANMKKKRRRKDKHKGTFRVKKL